MQLLSHNSTHVTPNAGRPAASWQAGAGKEKKYENPISQIAQFGGEMKSRFSQILKKILMCMCLCLSLVRACACLCDSLSMCHGRILCERTVWKTFTQGFLPEPPATMRSVGPGVNFAVYSMQASSSGCKKGTAVNL